MPIRSVEELELAGRAVLVRVDFNVPLSEGRVTDDTRIVAALPTLRYLLEQGARVIVASHLGRPKGKRDPALSLEPAAALLAQHLRLDEVCLTDDCVGDGATKVVKDLRDGQVAVLENLRFHAEETDNDPTFAAALAEHCDVYVNDAFGAVHRAHASVSALPALMEERGAGLLMLKELQTLERLRTDAPKPYVAVLGGAKVSDKIGVIEALMDKVDAMLIGGAMANTFLAAQGHALGQSLVESDKLAVARTLLKTAKDRGVELGLPRDVVVGAGIDATDGRTVDVSNIPDDQMALDIGPKTLQVFIGQLRRARSIFWNGPMGLFENPAFSEGTVGIAHAVADCPGFSVVGGGDSVAAVQQADLAHRYDHVSTGGGASLEYLQGRTLPGLQALQQDSHE